MAELSREDAQVNARIVFWGVEGAGKTTNLKLIHRKLRPDHRGELREVPTRLDPTASYEVLPIELGEINGLATRIQLVAAPGAPEHAPTRKQLLDQVDGIVLVIDSQRGRLDENLASFEELRAALAAYGRSLAQLPVVVQYNKRDLSDSFAREDLHRKLDLPGAAAFETLARDGTGVLQCLTTISKRVIRVLRERSFEAPPAPARDPSATALVEPDLDEVPARGQGPDRARSRGVETAILEEAGHPEAGAIADTVDATRAVLDRSFEETRQALAEAEAGGPLAGLAIAGVGRATLRGDVVRIPLMLRDDAGRRVRVALSVRLETLPEPEPDA